MPSLSRQNSSFGPSSRSSNHSLSSAIFDRFRGFGSSSRDKALQERWRRPLTVRNVETWVEDQRVEEAMGRKDRSMNVKIAFWLRTLPEDEISEDGIKSTQLSMQNSPKIEDGFPSADLPDGGSYSESVMAER